MKKLLIIFIILLSFNSWAQKEKTISKKQKIGLSIGKGSARVLTFDYGAYFYYFYKVYLFQLQWYYTLKENNKTSFEMLFQPQYNLSEYKPDFFQDRILKGYEYGLNFGLLYRRKFNDNIYLYGLISAGPHFVSGTPARQKNGFIFSDNFNIGLNLKVYNKLFLDLRPGWRHISNAELKQPNGGVNSMTMNVGVFLSY